MPSKLNQIMHPYAVQARKEKKEREEQEKEDQTEEEKKKTVIPLNFHIVHFLCLKNNTSTQDSTFLTPFSKIQADIYW